MLSLKLYFQNLTIYDYIGFGWLFLTFIILVIFSLYFFGRKPMFAIFMLFISFLFIPGGFLGIKYFLDNNIRKNSVNISKIKPLHFTNSLIVEGDITNKGKIDFKKCILNIKIKKSDKNKIRNFINLLKSIRKVTMFIDKPIAKMQNYHFKTMINDITYKKDYNVSASAICY